VRPVLRWLHMDGGRDFFKAVTEGDAAARAAGALVVEVGAGDGKQAVETAALGYTVLSIDGSRGAVGQGRNLQRAATRAAGGALRGSLQWVHSAVGDRTGTATFLEHGGGIGRLLDAGDPAAVTHRDNPKWKGAKVTVPLNTLDDLLGNRTPYILKIDVEGHELNVLRGASGVLSRWPAIIILEFNPAMMRWSAGADAGDLLELLHSLGYDLYDAAISEPGHKGFLQRYRGAHHRPTGFRELVDWFNLSTRWDWWGAWTDIVALRPDQDQYVAPWP
jgi:FkbM family methyltransferase